MKDCEYIRSLLYDYVMGKLDTELCDKVEKHLAECESCRKAHKAQKLYCDSLSAAAEYLSVPQKDLKGAVLEQIEAEKENPPQLYSHKFRFPYATAASLILIIAVFIVSSKMGLTEQSFSADNAESAAYDSAVYEESVCEAAPAEAMSGAGGVTEKAEPMYDTYTSSSQAQKKTFNYNYSAEIPETTASDAAESNTEEGMMLMMAPSMGAANEAVEESDTADDGFVLSDEDGVQSESIQILTIERLQRIVAEKGDGMTWSDFEEYYSEEIGSGLYIMRYSMTGPYYLTLSGGSVQTPPADIRLVSSVNPQNYITLPDGDIDKFISYIQE